MSLLDFGFMVVFHIISGSFSPKPFKESLDSSATKYGWVEVNAEKLSGKFVRQVERKELPADIAESQIVEYYNRKL